MHKVVAISTDLATKPADDVGKILRKSEHSVESLSARFWTGESCVMTAT